MFWSTTVQHSKALARKAASEDGLKSPDALGSVPFRQEEHAVWTNSFRKTAPNEDLRPWEARALGQAGKCTAYVELHFSFLVLNNPRGSRLLTWFLDVSQQKEEGPFDRPLLYRSKVIEY
jgi:hypothetical protein